MLSLFRLIAFTDVAEACTATIIKCRREKQADNKKKLALNVGKNIYQTTRR
jgi:hypothetical protein